MSQPKNFHKIGITQYYFLDKRGKTKYHVATLDMRKEVLVAITLGAILGLVIAFGVYRANVALAPKTATTQTQATQATSQPVSASTLIITQPEDEALVDKSTITVEGRTTPQATVVITTPVDEVITASDSSGAFSAELKLDAGANTILVTAISGDATVEQELTVTYSTEFKQE